MAYLTRYEINEKIINVLIEFDGLFQWNKRYFWGNEELFRNSAENHRIVRDRHFMRDMLRKLDRDSIVSMYKSCGALADKYNLRSKNAMAGYNEVGIKEATIEDDVFNVDRRGLLTYYIGFEHQAPQALCGYANRFDDLANSLGFNIHATRFVIGGNVVLRLWKGLYALVIGGEIGFYGEPESKTSGQMKALVDEAIKRFLEILDMWTQEGARRLADLLPDELKGELVRLLLSSGKIEGDDNQPLRGQGGKINSIRDILLLSREQFILKVGELRQLVSVNSLTFIAIMYRTIRFIVELRGLLITLGNDEQDFSPDWGRSQSPEELRARLGLTGTAVQVFYKLAPGELSARLGLSRAEARALYGRNGLIAEHEEYDPEFWTTSFAIHLWAPLAELNRAVEIKDLIYTVNHFYFKDRASADYFYNCVFESRQDAEIYPENKSEKFKFEKQNDTTVIIVYGKET